MVVLGASSTGVARWAINGADAALFPRSSQHGYRNMQCCLKVQHPPQLSNFCSISGARLECAFCNAPHGQHSQNLQRVYATSEVSVLTPNEIADDGATKSEVAELNGLAPSLASASPSEASSFISDVVSLIKLVDSKDIAELELKHKDYEISIRKQEAFPTPQPQSFPGPHVMAHTMYPYPAFQSMPAQVQPVPAAPSTIATTTEDALPSLPPPPPAPVNEFPPMLSPMAGTFYRSSGPGEPPFVKVGDKIQKGQVVCIIEAMKLMNEIEADQSGTIMDILADDGKPVSMESPLFVIRPS